MIGQPLSTKSGGMILIERAAAVALSQVLERPTAVGAGDPPSLQLASQDRRRIGGAGAAIGASLYGIL